MLCNTISSTNHRRPRPAKLGHRHGSHRIAFYLLFIAALGPHAAADEPTVLQGHANVVSSVRFTREGLHLISGSWDKTVRVWQVETAQLTETLTGHEDWVMEVATSTDGSLLSATQEAVHRWRSPRDNPEVYGGLGGPSVNAIAFSPDGQLVATGGRDGQVRIWRVGAANPQAVVDGIESWVSCLAISADYRTLVTGTRSGEINSFDVSGGTTSKRSELAPQSGQQVLALAIDPSGTVLASGGIDTTVRLWDLPSGKELGKLAGHKGVITAIAWSPDGQWLATGERHGAIKIWNHAEADRLVATLPGHSDNQLGFTVTALAFSPDARRLASGSYDKTVKIWKIKTE